MKNTPLVGFLVLRTASSALPRRLPPGVRGSLLVWWIVVGLSQTLPAQTPGAGATPTASNVGGQIVAFCQGQLGKQVGDGECSSLADAALGSVAARSRSGGAPAEDDYSWGDLAAVMEAKGKSAYDKEVQARKARPGDIIQFRDVLFTSSFNGAYSTRHHHTAVVVAVTGYGKQIQILEQNFGGSRVVIKNTLNVDDMREGWMRIYHPAAKE